MEKPPSTTGYFSSPIGVLAFSVQGGAIRSLRFLDGRPAINAQTETVGLPLLQQVRTELGKYFEGHLQRFSIPLPQFSGLQADVLAIVNDIPYGSTMTYAQIAQTLGNPQRARAVGRAVGLNPLPIVVPCHRVLGSNGKLTGYLGGLAKKQWLLAHEQGGTQKALF